MPETLDSVSMTNRKELSWSKYVVWRRNMGTVFRSW